MKGMRALTDDEVIKVLGNFKGKFALRDKALFILGIKSGFRISEILSLTIGDVFKDGNFLDRVYVERKNMKCKREGRCVLLHPDTKAALTPWIQELLLSDASESTYLFKSRNGDNRPISRVQAWKMLDRVFTDSGISGHLGTHVLRKSFAKKIYSQLGHDLLRTQRALGHKSINSTISYLSFNEDQIDQAILSI